MGFQSLPKPQLDARPFGARRLIMLTDERLFDVIGVRIAFTARQGGVSRPPFDSLNLGNHVGDDFECVQQNRQLVLEALGAQAAELVVPSQVHGTDLVVIESKASADNLRKQAAAGCDGIVVNTPQVVPMLCFADCAPVIIVAPTKTFAVVHAGWRGAVAGIVSKAIEAMACADGYSLGVYAPQCNVYIGPHIGVDCFETGVEVQQQFINAFGTECVREDGHVNLTQAIKTDVASCGGLRNRVVSAGICTQCNTEEFFSYRASKGTCGRHGACAFYLEG